MPLAPWAALGALSLALGEAMLPDAVPDECSAAEDCGFVALQTRAVSNVIEFDHLERAQFRTKGQKCQDFRVTGKVQMVHYRNWAVGRARRYGVKGWVANGGDSTLDGSHSPCPTCGCVLGHVEGSASAVEQFVREMCRGGPPNSYTKSCKVHNSDCFSCGSFYKENRFCKTWDVKQCKRRC
ncbi:unnamed protein product [Cladocopium goreaui]|uniref:acylphosphatase n=1 Tax=Cladocopium goreaui TaxID=2562237 RepID=A0A9P1C4J2_9DINO|nr:unnamed protein product [Cladocopium goreaui]